MAYARSSSSLQCFCSQCVSFSPRGRSRHLTCGRDLAAWPGRGKTCNERMLRRPRRRTRRQCLLQEWLRSKDWLREGWNDLDRAREEWMTEEAWINEEEQECAADLLWAERAFKSGRRFKDRPRRDSHPEPDEDAPSS